MPSLRKKVSSYFRQLSFYNEPRDKKYNVNENSFVTRYLEGQIAVKEGPAILYGKNPTDLPNHDLGSYEMGPNSVIGCYSGPNGGLTTVKRLDKHLSVPDHDIDFIDTQEDAEAEAEVPVKATSPLVNKVDNMTMLIKVAGQEYLVTNRKKHDNKSHSLGSLSDFEIEIEKTKICTNNNNCNDVKCKNQELADSKSDNHETETPTKRINTRNSSGRKKSLERSGDSSKVNYGLSKSKSEGNPFPQKKKGKIIRIASRQANARSAQGDSVLPDFWNRTSDFVYGISNSLYDKNQVTKQCNGDPIADCFGVIARNDSAILAVADGVNWGEKASIAAKSAVHGCLHYLSKTIFNDTKSFDDLNTTQKSDPILNPNRIGNTREVFVSLLRAFNCAHDLILENEGMLTTLTVAVVLPLKSRGARTTRDSLSRRAVVTKPEDSLDAYVCCVCNVGDTLAYVYSHKYGVRELTKGSHDINCNRDMRDALGALGPVDGINPELSNLTLSLTTVHKGDIIMIASDGLTDNFDPNVCKFTVNTKDVLKPKRSNPPKENQPSSSKEAPVKPPRKNKPRVDSAAGEYDDPLVAQFMRENSHDSSTGKRATSSGKPTRPVTATAKRPEPSATNKNKSNTGGFLRSKTSLDMRASAKTILRNEDGIPFVTPLQRYEISLLLMEDILKRGISGHDLQCTTARKVCENLVDFTFSISSAKRHTLEDSDLYFDNLNGVMVEVSQQEKKIRRRRGLERVQNLPEMMSHYSDAENSLNEVLGCSDGKLRKRRVWDPDAESITSEIKDLLDDDVNSLVEEDCIGCPLPSTPEDENVLENEMSDVLKAAVLGDELDITTLAHNAAGQAEHVVRRLIQVSWNVCHFNKLPDWLQDNDFLTYGHRPPLPSFRACFKSIFRLHTETANIWTHLLGCVAFIGTAAFFLCCSGSAIDFQEKMVFGAFFMGAIFCLGFSWVFHTVNCHSQLIASLFSKLDYCGISLLIMGSFVPWVYYGFYCNFNKKVIYLSAVSVLGFLSIMVSLWDKFSEPAWRSFRAGVFMTFGLSGIAPAIHYGISEGWTNQLSLKNLGLLLLMGVLYIVGAVMYALRIPERFCPGKFDIWLHSHQIFHVFVLGAAFVHYHGISEMAMHRLSIGECEVPFTPIHL